MDIFIPDEWLREFLETRANQKQISEYLSLCGPSVEKITGEGKSVVYSIEVTGNRVDSASILGIAREAAAILPRFDIKANLKYLAPKAKISFAKKVPYLSVNVDETLCPRFTAILIRNVKVADSPESIKMRLKLTGQRPVNNIVDISNYLFAELGQPMHTFDYDKIEGAFMKLRESKKNEKITTLDGKTHVLPGGDIVIEDGSEKLIDLAGIMGGKNTEVTKDTKNVLVFVQVYKPSKIRRTSMSLAHRTNAAKLFEKDIDPEGVSYALSRAVDLMVEFTGGKPEKVALDLYAKPYKLRTIKVKHEFISNKLGVTLSKKEIENYLNPLGFKSSWTGEVLTLNIPSYRSNDIEIPEDIVEEVARIYGYHNLPSVIMTGEIPEDSKNTFRFESRIKHFLADLGGNEIYTLSLVPKTWAGDNAVALKNPLGKDSAYMRTSLKDSILQAAKDNSGWPNPYHLFEVAHIYLPRKNDLPEEKRILAGVFAKYDYREAKGIIESLLTKLNIPLIFHPFEESIFDTNKAVVIGDVKSPLGKFGVLNGGQYIYYEFGINNLYQSYNPNKSFTPISKYPPQIEDITLVFGGSVTIGNVIKDIENHALVTKAELTDMYKDNYTIRVWYQNPAKTLTNSEVERARESILNSINKKFGGIVK